MIPILLACLDRDSAFGIYFIIDYAGVIIRIIGISFTYRVINGRIVVTVDFRQTKQINYYFSLGDSKLLGVLYSFVVAVSICCYNCSVCACILGFTIKSFTIFTGLFVLLLVLYLGRSIINNFIDLVGYSYSRFSNSCAVIDLVVDIANFDRKCTIIDVPLELKTLITCGEVLAGGIVGKNS